MSDSLQRIEQAIRDIPDYPKPGILFKDISTLLADGAAYQEAVKLFTDRYQGQAIDLVVAVEARGFLFGAPLAVSLGAGFVPVRKPGKLPYDTISVSYELEYGQDTLEMHKDAIKPDSRVLIVDDLLATGGTTEAAISLVQQLQGQVLEVAVLIELGFLNGRAKLNDIPVYSALAL